MEDDRNMLRTVFGSPIQEESIIVASHQAEPLQQNKSLLNTIVSFIIDKYFYWV